MLHPPTANDTRSRLADWLELQAIFSSRQLSSKGDLLNVLDIADDERADRVFHDAESGEDLDQEILEEPKNLLLQSVFEELDFRQACLGDAYPFSVEAGRMVLRAEFSSALHYGQVAYTFCLFASALRDHLLEGIEDQAETTRQLELLFQVCACLAAAGYFGGSVCSFGFPRPEGTAFLPALRDAYKRFGHGDVRESIEAGLPGATKDGGIDVIAWRDHPDRLPGKLYSLGQCASGKNWKQKPVASDVAPFHGTWFTTWPANFYVPALYIPFTVHDDLDEPPNDSFEKARLRNIAYHERKFGIIFDRLRIAHHVADCMSGLRVDRSNVDGAGRAEEIALWVNRTVEKVLQSG